MTDLQPMDEQPPENPSESRRQSCSASVMVRFADGHEERCRFDYWSGWTADESDEPLEHREEFAIGWRTL